MEKILITGSKGYLGACVYEVLKEKYKVDQLKVRLEEIEPKTLDYNIVIHSAGALRYREGQHKNANSIGTKKLLEGLKGKPKLVYISSKSIYGIGLNGVFNENSKVNPTDDYGISKYEGERHIVDSGLQYLILRSSTIYGLGVKNLGPAFPSKALKNLNERKALELVAPDIGHEYLYVWDLAKIINLLISNPNSWNNIFNVSGRKGSIHQLVNSLVVELKTKKKEIGKIQLKRMNIQNNFFLDSSKLENILGTNIYTDINSVVNRMVDYITQGN